MIMNVNTATKNQLFGTSNYRDFQDIDPGLKHGPLTQLIPETRVLTVRLHASHFFFHVKLIFETR